LFRFPLSSHWPNDSFFNNNRKSKRKRSNMCSSATSGQEINVHFCFNLPWIICRHETRLHLPSRRNRQECLEIGTESSFCWSWWLLDSSTFLDLKASSKLDVDDVIDEIERADDV
jgi:hypothetical protein